jgi:hypothetical protein
MEDPVQKKAAVQNVHSMYNRASEGARRRGAEWYPAVNDAVAKGIRRTSTTPLGGAGLVAAVSPNMDWEEHNIEALGELHSLRGQQWKDVLAGDRSPLAGMSISRATQSGLAKAHRILEGEPVDDVLSRQTAPKTNSFAHNINLNPDPVTIDGRAHDIAANQMRGWTESRGIQSAGLKTGKQTRYEHFEDAYRGAAKSINEEHGLNLQPYDVQAVTWEAGKEHERSFPTKSGKPRKKGVTRRGQSYV